MSTVTPQSPAPDVLARQLRLFKLLASLLAAVLILGACAFLYIRHLGQPVTIYVNGAPLATVRNSATANALIAAVEQAKVGPAYAQEEPIRLQQIRLERAPATAPQDTDSVTTSKLTHALTLHIHAFVIFVNGRPSVALPSAEAAAETVRDVKTHWAEMPPQGEIIGEPEIMENVNIARRAVDTSLARPDAATAAPYFWQPPASKSYTVHRGDIASRIAYRNHLSLTELITANPEKDMNRLKPGDVLNVRKMPLLLTVRVRKRFQETEKVHPNAPASEAGLQRVTYLVTYLNGQEIRREAQDIDIIERPLMRMDL